MRKPMRMLVASVASGAMFLVAITASRADDPANAPPAAERSINAGMNQFALPAGFQTKDLREENDIKKELASITEHAITKDHFDNLCNCLTKQDKDRIGKYRDRDVTTLNGRIDQLQRAWKEKYGKDFDFDNYKTVFNDQYKVIQGEVSDPAVAIGNWPVQPLSNDAMKASSMQRPGNLPEAAKDEKQAEKEMKLDKGRNVAIVQFPAGHDAPELTVSMIHQMPDNWKIDVPNNRTGEQIYNDLLTQLTWLGDHTSQWPADRDEAYRMFSHHVLAALYGASPTMTGGGAGGGNPSNTR